MITINEIIINIFLSLFVTITINYIKIHDIYKYFLDFLTFFIDNIPTWWFNKWNLVGFFF